MLHDEISKLVGAIYEAPYDAARWHRMTHDLRSVLDCRALLISTVDAQNQSLCSTSWLGPDDGRTLIGMEEYDEEFYQLDPTIAFAANNPSGKFCDVRSLVAPRAQTSDPYMKWYTDRFRSPYFAVCYTPPKDGLTFGMSVHPGQRDAVNHDLFYLLFDHLARSVAIAARPPSLESETDAVVLVQSSGRVVALSPEAERYFSSNDGLTIENGYLLASTCADTLAITRAIGAASMPGVRGSAGGVIFVRRPSNRRDWLLSVTPLPTPSTPAAALQARALVKIIDPTRKHSLSDEVCSRFQFTNRERQIADLLLTGHSPSSAARCLDISENTVKVHLQALFRKTQTNRQVEFIALLLEVS